MGLTAIRRSASGADGCARVLHAGLLSAYAGLSLSRPRWDVSLPGQIGGGTVWLFTHLTADEQAAGVLDMTVWHVPEGYSLETVQLPLSAMEVLSPLEGQNDWAVLQLHGGASWAGSTICTA